MIVQLYQATQYYYYRAVLAIFPLTPDQIRAQIWPNGVRGGEGALGRDIDDEGESMTPGKVDLPVKVLSVMAGDSHTAALANDGHVFIWGTFRDASGPIDILPGQGKLEKPIQIMKDYATSIRSSNQSPSHQFHTAESQLH